MKHLKGTIGDVGDPSSLTRSVLDQFVHDGAQRMLQTALEAEVGEYIERRAHLRGSDGHQIVVRNGSLPEREIATTAGLLTVKQPRVRDRRASDERELFSSKILPAYARRSPSLDVLLPVLFLKGISTGKFQDAFESVLGPNAPGFSASTITRLTEQWHREYADWSQRDLSTKQYAYLWADGIYSNVRLSEERPCMLVIVGATPGGSKELVAVVDGERESMMSWKDLLLDLKQRGLTTAPELAIADGALGFWGALDEVFPTTKQQICWVHKTANVLNALPKKLHPQAKSRVHEIYQSATLDDAKASIAAFCELYDAKYPKACATITRNLKRLLTYYDFPAEHWRHVRSTNVIESAFATIRHRTRQTKGNGSRVATLAMLYKLGIEAQKSWRRLKGYQQLALLCSGAKFADGTLVIEVPRESKLAA